jgi:putative FmdB family regulatory protein
MPVYEYKCEQCGARFDLRRSLVEDTEARCPDCGGRGRRVYSPVSVIFNGSGFYTTDNRGNGSKQDREVCTTGAAASNDP